MKKIFLLLAVTFLSLTTSAETLLGKVIKVTDGESFTVELEDKSVIDVCIYAIDTPNKTKEKSSFDAAKKKLEKLILSQTVVIEVYYRDTTGRPVAKISTANIADVATQLLKLGAVRHLPNIDDTSDYKIAEDFAKQHKFGIWK